MFKVFHKPKWLIQPSHFKALNLLELVVVVAFIAIIFTSGFQVFSVALTTVDRAKQSTLADLLSQDLLELSISKRNEGWDSIQLGEYYFTEDPDPEIGFVFVSGQETLNEFTRSVTITAIERDTNGIIVPTGTGIIDTNSFMLEAKTTWTTATGILEEVTLAQLITNWNGF